jgi:hypothetical protein
LPTYVGQDFDFSNIEKLADEMVAANVKDVQISGHGETTILPDWERYCSYFQNRGLTVCITSNFSKIFTDEEIDSLARMREITVSIDTVERELLKSIRRKVDLRTILYNMQKIRLRSLTRYRKPMFFNWQCTLSDLVVFGLSDWVEMGLLYGVKTFTLGNLVGHKFVAEVMKKENAPVPRQVAEMEKEQIVKACRVLNEACSLALSSGAIFLIQPGIIERINESLQNYGIREPFTLSNNHSGSIVSILINIKRRIKNSFYGRRKKKYQWFST